MRFSRAKPTGSFRIYQPESRRVASHHETLADARKDAEYWTKAVGGLLEIQERFPSGSWVTVEAVHHATKSTLDRNAGVDIDALTAAQRAYIEAFKQDVHRYPASYIAIAVRSPIAWGYMKIKGLSDANVRRMTRELLAKSSKDPRNR